jgi:catechol 2,3-dioxygenase-like lactoylglutathione lyase family enzyme
MTTTTPARLHHVAITVQDLDRSIPWYAAVFGIVYRMDVPHEGGIGKLMTDDAWELALVLHEHDRTPQGDFDEAVVGLDHIGFAIGTREDLLRWQHHLEENGVVPAPAADRPLTQAPIADEPYGAVLVFRDPDNIQLELFAPVEVPAQQSGR